MAAIWVCDGCGKQEPAKTYGNHTLGKPHDWFERSDEDGVQSACSRECIEKIAANTGKTDLVLPI
jgi:hypothetical protein